MADLSRAMATFAREVSAERDPDLKAQRIVDSAASFIESCDDAALTVVHQRTKVSTLAATSARPRRGDELQYELHEGPCLDAVWTQPLVHARDLTKAAERWPSWAPRVTDELGIYSMLCVRLYTSGESLGALNLYSESRNAFDHDEREEALVLAAHAAVAMAATHQVDGLHEGMNRRTVLGQATGVLMERYGIDSTAAFEVLRRLSQHQNRKIHDLAVELVTEGRTEGL